MSTRSDHRRLVPTLLVAALVGVVAFAGARLAQGSGSAEPGTAHEQATPRAANPAKSAGTASSNDPGMPEFADTEGDPIDARRSNRVAAEEAALEIVRSIDEVARAGFISRRELVESFTTATFGPEFASETGQQVDTLLMELGARGVDDAGLVLHEQPITVTSIDSADGVQVETWSVMIVAIPDLGPARQVWRSITLDMVEVDGAWLLDGWESEIGPTPAPPAEGLIDTADSVARVLAWRRVDGEEG